MMRLLTAVNSDWLYFDSHDLAKSVISSPCPIIKVEVRRRDYPYNWFDVTDKYYEHIKRKEVDKKMSKINAVPVFALSSVVDLSYKYGGMPNRVYINGVYRREQDLQWMYNVTMENTGEKTNMSESFIKERKSASSSAVYKNPEIKERINDGWRFCGNFDADTAKANAKLIAQNDHIKSVRLYPALNYNNQYINGQLGIWIVYKHTIYNDGRFADEKMDEGFINIK